MFNKLTQTILSRRSLCNLRFIKSRKSTTICQKLNNYNHRILNTSNFSCNTQIKFNYNDSKKRDNKDISEDSDDDEDELEAESKELQEKGKKVLTVSAKSLRLDAVVKAGLGISRNKVELAFYDSKIRKNGKKVLKKSEYIYEDDEIDLIHSTSPNNPNLITVSRILILKIKQVNDLYKLKIARDKNLIIEDKVDEE